MNNKSKEEDEYVMIILESKKGCFACFLKDMTSKHQRALKIIRICFLMDLKIFD